VDSYLKVRLDALRSTQNSEGGWGYFAGKESWLEPTAYAAMALLGEPASERAWKLLSSWQLPDGSWKPSEKVGISSWGTSLCVTLAMARNEWGTQTRQGVDWLLGSSGAESRWVNVLASKIGLLSAEHNLSLKAWPWKPDTSGWVEPTAHALVALKRVSTKWPSSELNERVRMGEAQLMDVRCSDGGWNYGSPAALGVDLPGYPETTALALLGLQQQRGLEGAFDLAWRMMRDTPSRLGRAWLITAMRLHGMNPPDYTAPDIARNVAGDPSRDIMIMAVEALSAPEGNWKVMRTGATTT
jgi:hypothetical protein